MALLFAAGCTAWTLTVLIVPITDDLGSTHAQLLGALVLAGVLAAVFAPVFGRIADEYGARAILVGSLILLGVTLVLTSRIQALWQFYLVYGIGVGLSQSGIILVGSQTVAANWFIRNRGIAFGVLAFPLAIGGLAFVPLSQAIVDRWDWRMVWLVMGLAVLVFPIPLVWLVVRRRPEDMGMRPDGDLSEAPSLRSQQSSTIRPRRSNQPTDDSWTLREAVRTRAFWLINASLFLVGFPASAIIVVMHPYFTELDLTSATAAKLVSFYSIANALGAPFWAGLLQLFPIRTLLVPFAILYGSAITLLVLSGGTSSLLLMYLALLPLGIGVMGILQLGNQVWADYYGRLQVGAIIGVSNLLRTGSMATGPLVAAAFHDTVGSYRPAFGMFAAFCFVAAVTFLFAGHPPTRRVLDPPPPKLA